MTHDETIGFEPAPIPDHTRVQGGPPLVVLPAVEDEPAAFGRYKVLRKLGGGGFGVVYLGFDGTLERTVAVKSPRAGRVGPQQVDQYLAEARTVAGLEHPAIVRVYDCGVDEAGRCFVVSQYIDGGDLSDWLKESKPEYAWAATLVARIADALHHAHRHRLVHRDVKPANILLDGEGTAYLADFGLAMKEQDFGRGSGYAGTPRYMSPEQARGEGHRVDGRSDVYSLGVVLYEMLTGRAPFESDTVSELLEHIQVREPPPMKLDAADLPAELERIVQKAMAKKASDRYAVALDFAEDLRVWLGGATPAPVISAAGAATQSGGSTKASAGGTKPARVVPKGLRAFDASDAHFFLRLVPGPRDRDGLPDSVRFWRDRIENRAETFSVGLLYGPSGGGKSSFVRAGLIPRISDSITVITVDATPDGTDDRVLAALRKKFPEMAADETLAKALTSYRRQSSAPLLLVIDQFEQWLAANPAPDTAPLTTALRQCDGTTIQTLLLMRDDFWMSATRFFHALEVPLLEGVNSAAIDLPDAEHAKRVLAGFGRAWNRLPAKRAEFSTAQEKFLDQAVAALADDGGRVVCVRLAMFAEMVKAKPWEPRTLYTIGGLAGVGVAYLEDTFGPDAPPAHKYHAEAVRAILRALLPPAGQSIKSASVSRDELLATAGYMDRPADADAIITILDTQLRLITPAESDSPHYALTHDFLVPAIRDWLGRRQKTTARGRAELVLAERAELWSAKPARRHEPSLFEWLRIVALTSRRTRTASEHAMMRRTTRHKLLQLSLVSVILIAGLSVAWHVRGRVRAEMDQQAAAGLVREVESADPLQLPGVIDTIRPLRATVDPLLIAAADAQPDSLRLALARDAEDATKLLELIPRISDRDLRRVAWYLVLRQAATSSAAPHVQSVEPDLVLPLTEKLKTLPDVKPTLTALAAKEQAAATKPMPDVSNLVEDQKRSEYRKWVDDTVAHQRAAARLTAALATLGDRGPLQTVLATDRGTAVQLIDQLPALKVPRAAFAGDYEAATTPAGRQWTLFAIDDPPKELLDRWQTEYLSMPDAGVHAALGWRLKKAGREVASIDRDLAGRTDASRNWTVNTQGQTFTLFREPTRTFRMGAMPGESDRADDRGRHMRTIPRSFAISSREVTVDEFRKLVPDYSKPDRRYVPSDDCPATGVSWFDVAKYCNQLNRACGLAADQDVYLFDHDGNVSLAPNALERCGYRLPTEAEWEYAARGGSDMAYPWGSADNVLKYAAWYNATSGDRLHPVGQLWPNAYGLFDTLGNAGEWVLDDYATAKVYPPDGSDDRKLGPLKIELESNRITRGGSFYAPATDARCARRFASPATMRNVATGFRLACTLPTARP